MLIIVIRCFVKNVILKEDTSIADYVNINYDNLTVVTNVLHPTIV